MTLNSHRLDLIDAGSSIGAKNKREQLRYDVIEHPALLRIRELRTLGTRGIVMVITVGAYLAPGRFFILMATRALFLKIPPARSTVQSAIGDERRV
jgi:hypothetical protein